MEAGEGGSAPRWGLAWLAKGTRKARKEESTKRENDGRRARRRAGKWLDVVSNGVVRRKTRRISGK